jgi:flagellar L-ring protein precursor FlgH
MNTIRNILSTVQVPLTTAILVTLLATGAEAQNSSLFHRDLPTTERAPLKLADTSWLYQKVDPPPVIKKHDLITIIVDEKQQLISEGDVQRRKNAKYDAKLKDWIQFHNGLDIMPAPFYNGAPRINGAVDQTYQAQMALETRDALKFRISAQVVDVLPNGLLVLEAHRKIRNNEEVWEQSLTGIVRPEDVLPNNSVLSEDIAELSISKYEQGHVRDGYRRGWVTMLYDRFSWF